MADCLLGGQAVELGSDAEKVAMSKKLGFTLIELLVVIAVIAVLAGLLFPVFARAREKGRQATCLANLKQIGVAFGMYTADHDGYYPNTGDSYLWMGRRWRWPLTEYLAYGAQRDPADPNNPLKSVGGGLHVLVCPSDPTPKTQWDSTSYAYSAVFYHSPAQINQMTTADLWQRDDFPCISQSESAVLFPSQKVLVAEWLTSHSGENVGWWDWRGARNYLFADGHVRYRPAQKILPAGNNLPDVNLTKDGVRGRDINAQ